MPPDSSGGGVDGRRQQNRDAQRRRRTALKLQIEELQAKNEELQTKNLELQSLKNTTIGTKESTYPLSTRQRPTEPSFFESSSTAETLPGRPIPHQFSWNDEGLALESPRASVSSASRSSICHSRRQSLHDKVMGRPLAEAVGQFRNTTGSSPRQPESSNRVRPSTLSLTGSSGNESASSFDPGVYLDTASDTFRPMVIGRPHSPSQSPLSNYFNTNTPADTPSTGPWTSTRIRPDSLAARECLPWADPCGMPKPAAHGQHARQKALRIAVANRQISSVELLIRYGADLNSIGDTGRTVLHDAAESNDGEMVQVLLGRGANANLIDRAGMTALEVASSLGNLEVAKVLLKSSLD